MKIGVIGAGSWGTALSKMLSECGHRIGLWAYEAEVVSEIRRSRENLTYLPGVALSEAVHPTTSFEEALSGAEMVFLVCPSHVLRAVVADARPHLPPNVPIVSATKGIENETLMTVSEILEDVLPMHAHPYLSYLSGPSFAREVAQNVPTAVVCAAYGEKLAKIVQGAFTTPYMRVYTSTDVIGVEMGGALKNVIAIAVGVAAGMGLGDNTRAGMITRGLNEMARLAVKRGANPLTLMGLSGIGDLVLTCTGPLSRNRRVGELLGKGQKLSDILATMKMVAEGIKTARSVYSLARRYDVEMPLSEQVYYVCHENKPVGRALEDLLAREVRREIQLF
ncbi:MAG: NAD(P)-dependent glycerol-3-phosphate dehydrogenase [Myxococcales bacterium]|nr:NAD(P)-dependent glycerol-3-phosphate dehydrogenase [Myxococcales bacterium]